MTQAINMVLPQIQALFDNFFVESDQDKQRLLGVELAAVLLKWESEQQGAVQKPLEELKRVGRWQQITDIICKNLPVLIPSIDEKKQALKNAITELHLNVEQNKVQLQYALVELDKLQVNADSLRKQVGLAQNGMAAVKAKQLAVHEQIKALNELSRTLDQLDTLRASLDGVNAALEKGEDPVGYLCALQDLLALRETLLRYYQTHQDQSLEITNALMQLNSHQAELAQVPSRLLALANELQAIDTLLQKQITAQSNIDVQTSTRE